MLKELLSNKIILTLAITYLISNLLKIIIKIIKEKKFDILLFFKTGGMPSSHSATITSVTVAIFFVEGITSVFALSLVMSIIVIRDALGVRHAADKQAHVINQIIDEIKHIKDLNPVKLSEFIGHTPVQVFVGTLLGLLVPFVLFTYVFI